jgi:uncharacterized protein (AIM24 family)
MSVKLKTPSNGSVTLAPEDTGSDVVLTVPAVAGEILNDQSDIETQVKAATNATGDAPIYACRAWVNFNGTGTVAIRASGNVSSITDNGTGDYTVNFATAMPDADYSAQGTADIASSGTFVMIESQSAGSIRIRVGTVNVPAGSDRTTVCVAVFR